MKDEDLPFEEVSRLLSYDSESGLFRWKPRPDASSGWTTRFAGQIAGTITGAGYLQIGLFINGKKVFRSGQRLAWLLHFGVWPLRLLDHKDHNPLNNRIVNLRLSTNSENSQHKMEVRGKIAFKGVYWMPKKSRFAAQIKTAKKWQWLGLHDTAEDAARAYDLAAREQHGAFAKTNADMGLLL